MDTRFKQALLLGGMYLGLVNISYLTSLESLLDPFFLTAWIIMFFITLIYRGKWIGSFIQNYPSFSLFLFCIGWYPYIDTPIVFLEVYLNGNYQGKSWLDNWNASLAIAETLVSAAFIISVVLGLILAVRDYRNSAKKIDKI